MSRCECVQVHVHSKYLCVCAVVLTLNPLMSTDSITPSSFLLAVKHFMLVDKGYCLHTLLKNRMTSALRVLLAFLVPYDHEAHHRLKGFLKWMLSKFTRLHLFDCEWLEQCVMLPWWPHPTGTRGSFEANMTFRFWFDAAFMILCISCVFCCSPSQRKICWIQENCESVWNHE